MVIVSHLKNKIINSLLLIVQIVCGCESQWEELQWTPGEVVTNQKTDQCGGVKQRKKNTS